MQLSYLTGRARDVRDAVNARLTAELAEPYPVILLVPAQFTLQAERDALNALQRPGSFQLQVFSPERLFARVFSEVGWPREARVDEQGRVMLMHAASQGLKKQLLWYRGAVTRPGFAERALAQIAAFKQAGLAPADVQERAEAADGALSKKLNDLSLLYEAYEQALAGRFMDGEDEQARAALRMADAPFLRGAHVFVHGFDLVTPALAGVVLSLLGCARAVTLALTLEDDRAARDHYLFEPVRRSLERLHARVKEAGIPWSQAHAEREDAEGAESICHLETELFAIPARLFDGKPDGVQMALCKNPDDEAGFAAAVARRLARTRGWRYRDIGVACWNADERSMDALRRAFALADVPLFLAAGRSADRHPIAQCVLSALRLAAHGFETGDVVLYIRSGFSGLTDDEADLLVNYAERHALRGKRWHQPLTIGDEAQRLCLEPLREKLMTPLELFLKRTRAAETTRERLTAVFELLNDLNAYDTLEETRVALSREGLGSRAMEGAQVWKRILDALDQMEELLGGERLSVASIYELLRRALGQAVVKSLPQAADAVEGGALDHLKGKPVKALIIVGVTDTSVEREAALLDETELAQLSDRLSGLSDEDRSRMRRLRLKSLLSMTSHYLLVTRPQSDASGRALQPDALMNELARLMPSTPVRGGVTYDAAMHKVRLEQPDVALARLNGLIRTGSREARVTHAALQSMPDQASALHHIEAAAAHRVYSEKLPPALAKALCSPTTMSASRLEQFVLCPFKHFARYVLKPEEFHAFELSPRDAGTFYHAALEAFVRENADKLGTLPIEESRRSMDAITESLALRMRKAPAFDSALAAHEIEALQNVARRAAEIVTRQFDGSRFRPVAVEADLSSGEVRLALDDQSALSGRIDRVDVLDDVGEQYLRVIDYKTNGRSVGLCEMYYGLELQLMVYLASALAQRGGKPAGVFYFNVSDPLIDTEERDPERVEEAREKQLKLDGLVLADERVVRAMATRPELSVNVGFKTDGMLRASDKLLSGEDFDALIAHTMQRARDGLTSIRAGETSITPANLSGRTACEHCDHRTLCQFDERLPGALPRKLKPLSARQVMDALRGSQD